MAAQKKPAARKQKSSATQAPWQRPAPKIAKHKHLSARKKALAKASAKRAGRRYPNLVDNMRAARRSKK